MSDIRIIEGGIFRDHRGELVHVNDFHLEGAHRYYIIRHDNTEVIRGWHGHQHEAKWFQCLRGGFRTRPYGFPVPLPKIQRQEG